MLSSLAFFVDVFMFIVVCSIGELFRYRLGRQPNYRSRLLMQSVQPKIRLLALRHHNQQKGLTFHFP